jgi:hypothetical protein
LDDYGFVVGLLDAEVCLGVEFGRGLDGLDEVDSQAVAVDLDFDSFLDYIVSDEVNELVVKGYVKDF